MCFGHIKLDYNDKVLTNIMNSIPKYSIKSILSVLFYFLLGNLIIPLEASAAFILADQTNAPATVDLTVSFPADWIHWGYVPLDIDRKNGVTAQISDYTKVGGASPGPTDLVSGAYSWSDGIAPGGNISATRTGERVFQVGKGFQFTVPADTTLKTLRVYVGSSSAQGLLTATLSDASAPDYTITIDQASGRSSREVSLDFIAGADGQTLTVSYVVTGSNAANSFITLESAALENVGTIDVPTLTGSMTTVSNINLTTKGPTDWVHWGRISSEPWDRKAGITPLLSDQTHVGIDVSPTSTATDTRYDWFDGQPNTQVFTQTGLRVFDINKGMSFTAPANTSVKTLKVYVGLNGAAQARFTATLSDGSALPYSTVVSQTSGRNTTEFTLNYQAAAAGQTLLVSFVRDNALTTGSWVTLEAAKLLGTTGFTLPPASPPASVTASDDSFTTKIALGWDSVGGATSYDVYRSTTAGSSGTLQDSPTGTSFDDTTAIEGSDYFYSVIACNSVGCTDFSTQDAGRRAISAPTGVAASDDEFTTKIAVNWTSVPVANSYEVYRSTTLGDNGTLLDSSATNNYDDTSAVVGTSYYYSIKACNSGGSCSDFSSQDVGTRAILVVIPEIPTGVAASDDSFTDRVAVNWNPTSGATSYEVYRSTVSGSNGVLIAPSIGINSYDDNTANAATDYFYNIKACNSAGCSGFSAQDPGRRAETVPTNPPGTISASDDVYPDKVAINWDAVAGSTYYNVYRSTVMGNNGTLVAPSITGTSYDDTSAEVNTIYYYSVKACNSAGCSAFSAQDAGSRTDPLAPVFTKVPDDITTDATGLLTPVDIGSAIATDSVDGELIAEPDLVGPFESGRHIITWSVKNSSGITATAQQIVDVQPMADFQLAQNVGEGGLATVTVHLSGQAAVYPVTIPYTVSGTAGPGDHDATSGDVVITQGTTGQITFNVVADELPDEGETIIITMGALSNAATGTSISHVSTIIGENLPPQVQLISTQTPLVSNSIVTDQGNVVISTSVKDPNPVDTHTFDWSQSDNILVPVEGPGSNTFTFDPSSIPAGVYVVRVTVTDDGTPPESTTTELMLRVDTSRLVLTTSDSDNDGINDVTEGYGDSDNDGIPDYLDAVTDPALLPGSSAEQMTYMLQVNPGLTMKLGQTAIASDRNSASVTEQNIADNGGIGGAVGLNSSDDNFAYSLGIFDFAVSNLPITGQSINIVIPVQGSIPDGATYRIYLQGLGWQDFVEDANNKISSTMGAPGVCPLPDNISYTDGLGAGHYCIQLTIEDGGPNDTDGEANSVIRNLGAVAQPAATIQNNPDQAASSGGGGGGYILMLISMIFLATRKPARTS